LAYVIQRGPNPGRHVQEELVEQSVLFSGNEEGLGLTIFGLDAVSHVVLLEVEHTTCMEGIMIPL
jgi:hypothetical protein